MLGFSKKTTLLLVLLLLMVGQIKNLFCECKKDFLYLVSVSFKFRFARFKRHFSSCCAALLIFKSMIINDYRMLLLFLIGVTLIFWFCYSYLFKLLHVFYESLMWLFLFIKIYIFCFLSSVTLIFEFCYSCNFIDCMFFDRNLSFFHFSSRNEAWIFKIL